MNAAQKFLNGLKGCTARQVVVAVKAAGGQTFGGPNPHGFQVQIGGQIVTGAIFWFPAHGAPYWRGHVA